MSILNKALEGFASYETKEIESLGIEVRVSKMSVKQANEFQSWQTKMSKNKSLDEFSQGVEVLKYVLAKFFFDEEGNPLLEEDQESIIENLPVEAINEFTGVFQEVNGMSKMTPEEFEEAIKKK